MIQTSEIASLLVQHAELTYENAAGTVPQRQLGVPSLQHPLWYQCANDQQQRAARMLKHSLTSKRSRWYFCL
jgi:hypothetical protein